MGRRVLSTVAVAVATLGVAAGPALARSSAATSLSHGQQLTHAQRVTVNRRMRIAERAMSTQTNPKAGRPGTARVLSDGSNYECTVPEAHGKHTNLFTKDTTAYVEFTGMVLVADCSADLTKPQVSAPHDHVGPKTMIPFPGYYATYSEGCEIAYHGLELLGDAESIVYPDGMFTETCVVPAEL